MICEAAKEFIIKKFEHGLAEEEEVLLRAHIEQCEDCKQYYLQTEEYFNQIKKLIPKTPDMVTAVKERINRENRAKKLKRNRFIIACASAAAVLVVCAFTIPAMLSDYKQDEQIESFNKLNKAEENSSLEIAESRDLEMQENDEILKDAVPEAECIDEEIFAEDGAAADMEPAENMSPAETETQANEQIVIPKEKCADFFRNLKKQGIEDDDITMLTVSQENYDAVKNALLSIGENREIWEGCMILFETKD